MTNTEHRVTGIPWRVVILISGRGSNMEAILRSCRDGVLAGLCEVVLVVSNHHGAAGLARAGALGTRSAVLDSAGTGREAYCRRLTGLLAAFRPDFVVLAGFDRVLSEEMVARYRSRIVNIHPADPVEYRGLHGYRWAFEQGRPETKVTVHLVDEGVDTGPVLAQETVSLEGCRTVGEVEARGLEVEHRLYPEVLARLFTTAGSEGGPCAV